MDETMSIGKQLRQQSKESLITIYSKYGGTIYGLLCRVVRDKKTADDILLQTFEYAWKNSHTAPTNDKELFFWLLKFARLFIKEEADYKTLPPISDKASLLSFQQQSLLDWFFLQYCSKDEIAIKLNISIDCLYTELRVISLMLRKHSKYNKKLVIKQTD